MNEQMVKEAFLDELQKIAAGLYDARKFGSERLNMMEDSARQGFHIRAAKAANVLKTPNLGDTKVVAKQNNIRADLTDTSRAKTL